MKFFNKAHKGQSRLCILFGDKYLDIEKLKRSKNTDTGLGLQEIISNSDTLHYLSSLCEQAGEDMWTSVDTTTSFNAPIPSSAKIVCVASNYRAHITESGRDAPDEESKVTPRLFIKPSTCLTGHLSEIILPSDSVAIDWEIELGVVIGRRAKRVKAEEAADYIFGYTVINDISERKFNPGDRTHTLDFDRFFDWQHGKWHDTFAPCGPYLVTADEIANPMGLELGLRLNGELMQKGNTAEMIVGIHELIAFASRVMTLEPGDIIATGTPSGVGNSKGTFLKPGDTLEGWVEKIGTLQNKVVAENEIDAQDNYM